MRVIQTCTFKIGTKIPYSEYPAIVHRFFEEQNLVSNRFLYYFDELIHFNKTYEETLAAGSCAKAVKDCPELGKIRLFDGTDYERFQSLFVSNIDTETDCTEANILPHMKKIHRRYGFCESNLYYYDINFFHNVIPFERDMSYAEHRTKHFQCAFDPTALMHRQPYGSGIQLHRHITGSSFISLSIDLLHNGIIHDATPYFNAMKALLPHIHPTISMKIHLSEEEKQEIASWDKQIVPTLEKSRSFFAQRFPGTDKQNNFPSSYTVAPKLKKLAKQYGFSYHYEGFGVYMLDKRTPRGHVLQLCVDSGPSHFDTTYYVSIQGIGFCHRLCNSMQTPCNQAESDKCAEKIFSILSEFERTTISELDAFYAETPDWFVPSAFC